MGTTVDLLDNPTTGNWGEFTCLNSLRDVEPQVKFIIRDGGLDNNSEDSSEELSSDSAIDQQSKAGES